MDVGWLKSDYDLRSELITRGKYPLRQSATICVACNPGALVSQMSARTPTLGA